MTMPDRTEDRTCVWTSKMRYDSKVRALKVLDTHARSYREGKRRMTAYFCDRCGGWHLGHQPGRKR